MSEYENSHNVLTITDNHLEGHISDPSDLVTLLHALYHNEFRARHRTSPAARRILEARGNASATENSLARCFRTCSRIDAAVVVKSSVGTCSRTVTALVRSRRKCLMLALAESISAAFYGSRLIMMKSTKARKVDRRRKGRDKLIDFDCHDQCTAERLTTLGKRVSPSPKARDIFRSTGS